MIHTMLKYGLCSLALGLGISHTVVAAEDKKFTREAQALTPDQQALMRAMGTNSITDTLKEMARHFKSYRDQTGEKIERKLAEWFLVQSYRISGEAAKFWVDTLYAEQEKLRAQGKLRQSTSQVPVPPPPPGMPAYPPGMPPAPPPGVPLPPSMPSSFDPSAVRLNPTPAHEKPQSNRDRMLEQIQQGQAGLQPGRDYEKLPEPEQAPRDQLLDQIRKGKELKKMDPSVQPLPPAPPSEWEQNILERRGAINPDEEDEEDFSQDWD